MEATAANDAEHDRQETAPPVHEKETGIAMVGDYPLNSRLRAEALAKAGVDEDPDELITPALIEDAKGRLERAAEAERIIEEERLAAFPPVNAGMKVADLEKVAADASPPIDLSSAANNEERVALILKAREPVNLNPSPPPVAPPGNAGEGATETVEA
jgi:hypothetical protein